MEMAAVNSKSKLKSVEIETENAKRDLGEFAEAKYDPQEHKDKTRSEIALYFVKSYIFPLVLGTVGTLLGFVLGYYFKSEEKS